MKKTYQIRYNTNSTDDSTSWRLISDGQETLVSDIYITAQTTTTKNYMEDLKAYKYHITCTGNLKIKDNVAYITNSDEQSAIKRHVSKTISYRILSTSLMIITTYSLGMSLQMSALIGVGEIIFKPVLYFFHERLWYKFRFAKFKK
jgi:uncharacterized membrane protein